MATPPKLIELTCPECTNVHWETDADYRGEGGPFVDYFDRPYQCPCCAWNGPGYEVGQQSPSMFIIHAGNALRAGYEVGQQSPPEFILKLWIEFDYWLGIYEQHFPEWAKKKKPDA